MAHPFGPGAMPLCGTEPCVHVSANSGNAPCADAGTRQALPACRGRPGSARPQSDTGTGIAALAAGRLRLVVCRSADRQSACWRPSFEDVFLSLPSVPSFSSVTVFATVATFSQPARVRFARCSPGPFAALRAAASAPALAVCLNASPLVARRRTKNWAEGKKEKGKPPSKEEITKRLRNRTGQIFIKPATWPER